MNLLAQISPGPKGPPGLTLPGVDGITSTKLYNPAGFAFGDLGSVVTKASTFIFAFAGLGLLLMLVMAGFTYLTSAGDAKKLEQAKGQLTNSLIGFALIFTAFWIVQIAGQVLGFETILSTFK